MQEQAGQQKEAGNLAHTYCEICETSYCGMLPSLGSGESRKLDGRKRHVR